MGLLPPVIIELQASITELKAKLGEAKTELDSMEAKGQSFGQKFAAFGSAAFMAVGAAAIGLGTEAIHLADQFEISHARLTASLEANGTSFEHWSSQIKAADQAGEKLGFTNSDVEDGLARLETMVKNPATALRDLAVAEDIARARGVDLTTASQLVGKAQDGNYASLIKLGVVTKEQAANFRDGADAVDALGKAYGGQAATYSETFNGKLQTLKATSEDLGKNLGLVLIPIVENVASKFADGLHWIQDNADTMKHWGEIIGAVIVPAFAAWSVAQAHVAVEAFVEFLSTAATRIGEFGAAAAATAAELYTMAAAEVAAGGPLSILAAGLGGLAVVLTSQKGLWNDVTDAQKSYGQTVVESIPKGVDLATGIDKVRQSLLDQMTALGSLKNPTDAQSSAYDDLGKKVHVLDEAYNKAKTSTAAMGDAQKDVKGALGDAGDAADADADANAKLADATKKASDAAKDAKTRLDALKSALDDLIGVHVTEQEANTTWAQDLIDNATKLGASTVAVNKQTGAINLNVQSGIDLSTQLSKNATDILAAGKAQIDLTHDTDGARKSVEDHVAQLDAQLTKLGLTPAAIAAVNAQYGLIPSQIDTALNATVNVNSAAAQAVFAQLDAVAGALGISGNPNAAIPGHAAGGVTTGPAVLVGEGNQAFPEYILPTDPAHRGNATKLLGEFMSATGIPAMAAGGKFSSFGTQGEALYVKADSSGTQAATNSSAAAITALALTETKIAQAKIAAQAAVGSGFGGPGYGSLTSWLGVPYLWGGGHGVSEAVARRNGVDCSGLVDQVYGQTGNTGTQVNLGTHVNGLASAVPGDLLFYGSRAANEPHHVGFFVGGSQQIDAPHTGANVRYDPIYSDLEEIRRFPNAPGAGLAAPVVAGGGGNSANRALGAQLAAAFGWDTGAEWQALDSVANRESGWNQYARNPSSGAYGIAQALPPTKYPLAGQASGGSSPSAQIGWMLDYIKGRYGDPLGAWQHEVSAGWYDSGKGILPKGLSMALNTTGANEMAVVVPQQAGGQIGGGDVHIHVHAALISNPAEVTKLIAQEMQKLNRGGWKLGVK